MIREQTSRLPSNGCIGIPSFVAAWLSFCLLGLGPPACAADALPKAKLRSVNLPVPVKILRYAQRLMEQYDRNGDGKLDRDEWSQMQGEPRLADLDRDGEITVTELANRVVRYGWRRKIRLMPSLSGGKIVVPSLVNPRTGTDSSEAADREKSSSEAKNLSDSGLPASGLAPGQGARRDTKFFIPRTRLPPGLPSWFTLRDADGDAQLTMAEYAPKATQSQLDEFALYDWNRDGVITAEECVRGPRRTGKQLAREAEEEAEEEVAGEAAGPAEESTDEASGETAPQSASEASVDKAAAVRKARLERARSKKLLKKPTSESS
jgi:hypothetical protein